MKKAESFAQQLARHRPPSAGDSESPASAPGKSAKADARPAAEPAAGSVPPGAETPDPAAYPELAAALPMPLWPAPAQSGAPSAALPAQALEIASQATLLQQAVAGQQHPQAAATLTSVPNALPGDDAQGAQTDLAGGAPAPPMSERAVPAAPMQTPADTMQAPWGLTPRMPSTTPTVQSGPEPDPLDGAGSANNAGLAALDAMPPTGASHSTPELSGLRLVGAAPTRQDNGSLAGLPLSAAPPLTVSTPVAATPAWGADLGRQLLTLSQDATQGRHTAELRLDPPDLGPLRVTLSVHDGVASASFVSAHAAVRHAVEAALPQLHQALAQAGLSLGHADVGEQGKDAGDGAQQQQPGRGHEGRAGQSEHGTGVQASVAMPRRSEGLVDTYA